MGRLGCRPCRAPARSASACLSSFVLKAGASASRSLFIETIADSPSAAILTCSHGLATCLSPIPRKPREPNTWTKRDPAPSPKIL